MPTPSPFTGAKLSLQSLEQRDLNRVRARFTNDPTPASGSSSTNYTMAGPGPISILSAVPVPGDLEAFDLILSTNLSPGTWTLTVANLVTAEGAALVDPKSLSFIAYAAPFPAPVGEGGTNGTAETILRQHIGRYFKGRVWDALIGAIAQGDEIVWDCARKAYRQMFRSTASGAYLDRRAADYGLPRPTGMADSLFRSLSIKTVANQITSQSIYQILEIFYGTDSVRAFSQATLQEPFALRHGDDLEILFDKRDLVLVTLDQAHFTDISKATTLEVAASITKACQDQGTNAFAQAVTDPLTGSTNLRIYSGSIGLTSSVEITSGWAQRGLAFPASLTTTTGSITSADNYNWVITNPDPDSTRFALTAGAKVDLSTVQEGDYVLIDGTLVDPALTSSIRQVKSIQIYWVGGSKVQEFDVEGDLGYLGSVQQQSELAFRFYRPVRSTTQKDNGRTVVVSQHKGNSDLDIQIPATTQAVGREVGTAAYLTENPFPDFVITKDVHRYRVNTGAVPHGLATGDWIVVDNASIPGANGTWKITKGTDYVFGFQNPNAAGTVWLTGTARICPMKAVPNSWSKAYAIDAPSGHALTAPSSLLAVSLAQGHNYPTLEVDDATVFPDGPGWVLVGLGTESEIRLRYLGVSSPTTLILDASYKMPVGLPVGSSVILLKQKGPYAGDVGCFYLTAANAGRVAAVQTLLQDLAAGFDINISIVYPGDVGLGGAGYPVSGQKVSDKVAIWGSDSIDQDLDAARSL